MYGQTSFVVSDMSFNSSGVRKSQMEFLTPFEIFGHHKIFCVNGNTGFRKESRIFYFIDLQNGKHPIKYTL